MITADWFAAGFIISCLPFAGKQNDEPVFLSGTIRNLNGFNSRRVFSYMLGGTATLFDDYCSCRGG
jgi:hypothetical protein